MKLTFLCYIIHRFIIKPSKYGGICLKVCSSRLPGIDFWKSHGNFWESLTPRLPLMQALLLFSIFDKNDLDPSDPICNPKLHLNASYLHTKFCWNWSFLTQVLGQNSVFSIFSNSDLDLHSGDPMGNPKLNLHESYLYTVSLKLVTYSLSYWAEIFYLFLALVTLTLILVTPYKIPNSVFKQAIYVLSFVGNGPF